MAGFMKKGLDWAGDELQDGLEKGKQKLQKQLGLGPRPNAVPPGKVNINGPPRAVSIGWHPVAGLAGKWFAERTGLGRMITDEIKRYPDPTQHWAVLVGEYAHELWMDGEFDVIYINEKVKPSEWHTFDVGTTRFNDEALRNAGQMTIDKMRDRRPAYNLIDNNCQTFALALLDAVKVGKHRQFATSFAVWKQLTDDPREIRDLFEEDPLDGHPDEDPEKRPNTPEEGTVTLAHKLMDENTAKIEKEDAS